MQYDFGREIRERAQRAHEARERRYAILQEQKSRIQNRRDAVIVSVSTVGAGFCATNAAELTNHPYYGLFYLFVGLLFVAAILLVIWLSDKSEKILLQEQAELGKEYIDRSAPGKWNVPILVFTVAILLLTAAFIGYFAIEYYNQVWKPPEYL